MMKTTLFFLLGILYSANTIEAQIISPPELNVAVYGQLISITWSDVEEAESFRLYYAPYPDAEVVGSVVVGLTTSLFAELPLHSAFYIAMTSLSGNDESDISNIEIFTVSRSQIDSNIPVNNQGDWYRPTLSDRWQWQLLGEVNTSYSVDLYDIDLFDVTVGTIQDLQAANKRVICYFSAGSYEEFREDAGKYSEAVLGNPLDGFPDERWLDIRSSNVHQIVLARLDIAKNKGCDGVEPDNMDGYINDSGFELTPENQLAFNRFVANEAHARGLSVALKNDLEQISQLVEYFDFSVNEQCHEFNECDRLQAFIDAGKPVYNAEYAEIYVNDVNQRNLLCQDAVSRGFDTLVLPLDLDDSFRFSCP